MDRLGLTEDELCRILGVDPLTVIAGDLDDKPQLPLLLALTEEAAERVGEDVLRRWLRATGPTGRPMDHLLSGDFGAFEDDLTVLSERGFVLRAGARPGTGAAPQPRESIGERGGGPAGGAPGAGAGADVRGRGGEPIHSGPAGGPRGAGPDVTRHGGERGAPEPRSPESPSRAAPRRATRRITADDAHALRETRLRALADTPLAFGSTHAREVAYPPERWEAWARDGAAGCAQAIFLAVDPACGDAPVGMATGVLDAGDRQTAHLYAMWVAPDARGAGAGPALLRAVTGWARDCGARVLATAVTVGNDAAARMYARAGFVETGRREPLGHSGAEAAVLELALRPDGVV